MADTSGAGGTSSAEPKSRSAASSVASSMAARLPEPRPVIAPVLRGVGPFGEQDPQPDEGAGQARFRGAGGDAERGRGLRLGEIEQVPARHDEPVFLAQPRDCGGERGAPLVDEDRLFGRRGRAVRGAVLDDAEREVHPPAGGAPAIARFIGDDPQQPRPERRALPEPAERPICLDKGLLDGVVGLRSIADQERGSMGKVLVGAHKFLVSGNVAAFGACDEVAFVQWSALHRATLLHRRSVKRSRRGAAMPQRRR